MNQVDRFNAMLNCHIDLLEILVQLSDFEDYIEHLERHAEWSGKVERQSVKSSLEGEDLINRIDEIEHKYSIILPLRQRYSYVLQFTSILEWSMTRILKHHEVSLPEHPKFNALIKKIDREMAIRIANKRYLKDLYKLRNKIAHANGFIVENDKAVWAENTTCTIQECFQEHYLWLKIDDFYRCIDITLGWLAECCASSNETMRPTNG